MVSDHVESERVACHVLSSVGVGVKFGYDYEHQAEINFAHIHHHRGSVLRPRPSTRRGTGRYPAFGNIGCGQVEYLKTAQEVRGVVDVSRRASEGLRAFLR